MNTLVLTNSKRENPHVQTVDLSVRNFDRQILGWGNKWESVAYVVGFGVETHRSHDFKVWALKDIRRLTHIFFIQEACLAIFFNYGDCMGTLWVDILNRQKSQHIVIWPKIYGRVFDQPSGNTCISMSQLLGYSFKMLGNKPYIRLARASVELLHSDIVWRTNTKATTNLMPLIWNADRVLGRLSKSISYELLINKLNDVE